MTRFLDVHTVSDLVRSVGLEKALADMTGFVVDDYSRWLDFELASRVAMHSKEGVIELMPTSDGKLYSFKYVNGHPKNFEKGLMTVMACGLLAEVSSGMPLLLSEMTLLTAMRTAAMSVAAARVLARKDSKSMAVIGNGAQSEFQILAFRAVLGINEFRLYDIDPEATKKLMHNLSHLKGVTFVQAASISEAVKGADIVTTITADKTKATIITPDMVEPGMHINGVGGDSPGKTELHPDVLRMGKVIVEYEAQSRIEGDIQQMPADFAVTELWEVLTGRKEGRTGADQVTVFDSVGFAISDFSALRYI
ncbi:MAG: ornithine cyclodeaminase, partial [Alphaproteobacteria bacterium]|nr:ornithine cyclodeaminase [Alphaproteobacteria bacterium]